MIKLDYGVSLAYNVDALGADFIFNIHAAQTPYQSLSQEFFATNPQSNWQEFRSLEMGNRCVRTRAKAGPFSVSYRVTAELCHVICEPEEVRECDIAELPMSALTYIYPSRYCQSDRLNAFAIREFGKLPKGYARVQAIQEWVQKHITFKSNTSNSNTSAIDTIIEQQGVCRDFAHVMIALCRALSIPARFVTGTDYGADPAMGPPDFHAYVEVYLQNRWFIFDPSGAAIPLGLLRIGTGRDAADVSFATIFGNVTASTPIVTTQAITTSDASSPLPQRSSKAISTAHV